MGSPLLRQRKVPGDWSCSIVPVATRPGSRNGSVSQRAGVSMIDRSLVASLPLFAGLDAAALDAILSEARSGRYAKNTTVFEQGEEAHSFFVLLHGHVRASKMTPAGQQVVVRYVTPGEIFGVAKAIGLT